MSNNADKEANPDRVAFAELEKAVGSVLQELSRAKARAAEAEARSAEFESIVKRFTGEGADAGKILARLADLESENEDLRSRIDAGREGVDRILAKVKYLEGQR